VFLGLLLIWEAISRVQLVKPSVLPGAWAALETLLALLKGGSIWVEMGASVRRLAVALSVGEAAGFLVGLAMWRLPLIGRGWRPILSSLYAMPLSAFYPALLLAAGVSDVPVVILGAIAAFVPVAIATSIGLAEVRLALRKVAAVFQCSWWQTLLKVFLPAALPDIVAGTRLAITYSFIYVIALEFINASDGLGFQIRFTYEFFRPREMYAYIVLVVTIALMQHSLLDFVQKRLSRHFG